MNSGQQGLVHVRPEESEPLVILGHFAEGQGFSLCFLEAEFKPIEEKMRQKDLIPDEINSGENEINRSENDIDSGENETD